MGSDQMELVLHSFLSISRIDARRKRATERDDKHSQSLASLRQRPSQAKVRSTFQRLGNTSKPSAVLGRLTIFISMFRQALSRPS